MLAKTSTEVTNHALLIQFQYASDTFLIMMHNFTIYFLLRHFKNGYVTLIVERGRELMFSS